MKKKLFDKLATWLLAFGLVGLAQANTATIGQTSVFTDFNYSDQSFSDLPNNVLPWPDPRQASVVGNTASVSLSASPGQAGQVEAQIGSTFSWDVSGTKLEAAKNLPATVTFDFNYALSANWTDMTGSANAGVGIPGFINGWQDFMGYETGLGGTLNGHLVKTFTQDLFGTPLTVGYLSNLSNPLSMNVYSEAHSAVYNAPTETVTATNTSSAQVNLNSISISTPSFKDIIRNGVAKPYNLEQSSNGIMREWNVASFMPNYGLTLDEAAAIGGFDYFNWYQVISEDTPLDRCISDITTCNNIDFNASGDILSLPYEDPPLGGYFQQPDDKLLGYWNASESTTPEIGALPAIMTPTSLSFYDSPCINGQVGDHYLFDTYLAGVDKNGMASIFIGNNTSFRWKYTQLSPSECGGISNLKTNLSDIIGPNEGTFEQIGFLTSNNISANELSYITRQGINIVSLDSVSVPEPSMLFLLSGGFAAIMFMGRKKRFNQC